jgi:cell fate regulator YaaT (PSP1 superfamily)
MRYKGTFRTSLLDLQSGEECVVRTSRGLESGVVLAPARTAADHPCSACSLVGDVLRRANSEDRAEMRRMAARGTAREARICRERLGSHRLPARLAGVEALLGGERFVVYFVSEERIDFRALVREISERIGGRVEMRQIGARDDARLVGEYGHCGRRLCCKAWLPEIKPISMRMAKLQKSTLDPAKISGQCGRLLCCLRYEDEVYTEFRQSLPRRGERVDTPRGPGEVVDQEVLARRLRVRLGSGERVTYPAGEVVRRGGPPPREDPGTEAAEPGPAE